MEPICAVYAYDSNGNQTEESEYVRGSVLERNVYKYDSSHNRIEWTGHDSDGAIHGLEQYLYDYDPTGNWIKKTTQLQVAKFGKTYFEPKEAEYRTFDRQRRHRSPPVRDNSDGTGRARGRQRWGR